MRRTIVTLILLATVAFANMNPQAPRVHTLKSGGQFILHDLPATQPARERDPQTPLDQGGDDCFSPTVFTTLPYCDQGTTVGYNDDYFEECGSTFGSPDVVYAYRPADDVTVSVSLLGSGYDTYLGVYETDIDCSDYWFYDCNTDANGGLQSCLEAITLFGGYTYYFVIDGENQEAGAYVFNIVEGFNCPGLGCSESGDLCDDPRVISSLPYCHSSNTSFYQDDYFPECNLVACGERDVVYGLTPTTNMFLGISVTSSEFQPHVEIWESSTDCEGRYLLGCATIHENFNSCITGVDVYAGFVYYILVDGHECSGDGEYTLNVFEGGGCNYLPCATGGAGETCESPIPISALPFSYSGTTLDMNNDYDFCSYEDGAPDIVFSYSPTTTHLADLTTCGNTLFESSIYIFRDGNTVSPFSACAPRPCYTFFGGFWSNAALYCFEFEQGHDYCIVIDGAWSYSNGPFVLDIVETNVELCDVNDYCDFPVTETEPNNSCSPPQFNPDTLFLGDTIAGNICEPGDVDYFFVETPEDIWNLVGVRAGPDCAPGTVDIGISIVHPEDCYVSDPCINCSWIHGCGPEVQAVKVAGLGDCYTGPYWLVSQPEPAPMDECDPVACTTAPAIECNVPTLVNTCDGCATPICQTYRNGCSGTRAGTGPQKFFALNVTESTDYIIDVAAVDTTQDVQFSIFTDCVLPRTTCVLSQDQNYWAQTPTGNRWEEHGEVSLDPGTYYLHVSAAWGACTDINVLVTCESALPCLPPDSVTIKWTTASTIEVRYISDGGTYDIFSTNFPNNDGDPRGGDPQWAQRATFFGPAGPTLFTDTDVTSAYRNYVVLKVCP